MTDVKTKPKLEKYLLWSSILMEFHKYTDFEGVFYSSGMSDYKLQAQIHRHKQTYASLDIITSDAEGNCCNIELTTNRGKDIDIQLDKHSKILPEEINEQIGITASSSPDIINCTNFNSNSDYCTIQIIDEKRTVFNVESLKNNKLAEKISNIKKHNNHPASAKFTIVPEPNEYELRNGISGIIMNMFYNGDEKTAEDIVNVGLDFLKDHYDFDEKQTLISRVTKSMDKLCELMPYAMNRKNKKYIATKLDEMGKKKKTISNDIDSWIFDSKNPQSKLEEFH